MVTIFFTWVMSSVAITFRFASPIAVTAESFAAMAS